MKNKIINNIIDVEGGYVNHSSDKGGATKYGITEKVARENGYTGNMKDLPREVAFDIYAAKYWDVNCLTELAMLNPLIAEEVADTGVNMGTKKAAMLLQRSLNVLKKRDSSYLDLKVDGIIGSRTLELCAEILSNKFGAEVLLKALNSLQGTAYIELAEKRELNKDFIYGWLRTRVVI